MKEVLVKFVYKFDICSLLIFTWRLHYAKFFWEFCILNIKV